MVSNHFAVVVAQLAPVSCLTGERVAWFGGFLRQQPLDHPRWERLAIGLNVKRSMRWV